MLAFGGSTSGSSTFGKFDDDDADDHHNHGRHHDDDDDNDDDDGGGGGGGGGIGTSGSGVLSSGTDHNHDRSHGDDRLCYAADGASTTTNVPL